MNKYPVYILTLYGGSFSIKFAPYKSDKILTRLLHGKIDRTGLENSTLMFRYEKEDQRDSFKVKASDHRSATYFLMDWPEKQD